MKRVKTVRSGKRPAISVTTGSTRGIQGVDQMQNPRIQWFRIQSLSHGASPFSFAQANADAGEEGSGLVA